MSRDRRFKRLARTAMVFTALCVSSLGAITPSQALGGNLLPNTSFESSALDTPSGTIGYTNPQPLLPAGWAFEGASVLFDHSQNGSHSGRRMAAISGNASLNRNICVPAVGCNPNTPANLAKDTAERAFSVQPAWRNALPVAVSAGTSYTASSWTQLDFCSLGTGASLRIRWLNGQVPLGVTKVAERVIGFDDGVAWAPISGNAVAPAGATAAVLLLTYTDDAFIGQVRFDDVFFGTT